jgi:hypothetical protein
MPERVQRYSEAERAGQAANRRAATGKAKYGGSFEQQGYRPAKEQGMAFLNREALKAKYGAFANPTWSYEDRGGQLYRKPLANQSGRIAEQGGTAQWEAVPDYVQRSYANPARRQFFEGHPELADRPGGGQDAWLHQKYLNGLQTDPATGMKMNRQGELYDANALNMYRPGYTGGAIGQAGMTLGSMGGAPGYGMPGGNMMQPNLGGLGSFRPIPGYSVPGQQAGGYQTPNINSMSYATQQGGGSTFGSYPMSQPYSNPFAAYQPGYLSGNY